MQKLKIGILGGSFDPPTTSHLMLCSEAINILKFDQVWVIPCGVRQDKTNHTSPDIRFEMTKKAIEDYFPEDFPVFVNDFEIQNGHMQTYPLMKLLQE